MARWGKVDYRQLLQLQKRLEKFEKVDRETLNEQLIKQLAVRMLDKVRKRTPADMYPAGSGKTSDTLKHGWTIGEVVKTGDRYEIEVINTVYYAAYVEYGYRNDDHADWVPGRFMMTISAQELEKDAPGIIEKALVKKLREVFGDD
ncbi:MAG TPA: HK97 gp10 family phage protein [Syntrophomonas sp.]|nr:HK97 gp10 family phage protein [Syntrophomonas sp.]